MDYEKNLWWKEVGLNAPNVITILGSIVNIIGRGGLHDHLMRTRIFTLMMGIRYSCEVLKL